MTSTVRNSAQWCALRLLRYIGVTSFDAAPGGQDPDSARQYLAEGDLDDVAGIMTAALQDIFADGPASLSEIADGAILHAPAPLVLNVSGGSPSTVLVSGWQDWMSGCSVAIPGDSFVNEFRNRDGLLRRAYLGATVAGVVATVYGNTVELAVGTKTVMDPVRATFDGLLYGCADRGEFDAIGACNHFSTSVRCGRAEGYFVETLYDDTLPYAPTYLRVAPAPGYSQPVNFRAKLLPPTINATDLGDSTYDPVVTLPVPGQWIESIFIPYCLQRFTGSPSFKNEAAKPEIARQFAAARLKLAGFCAQISRHGGGNYAFRP